jgi:hypothetical protein
MAAKGRIEPALSPEGAKRSEAAAKPLDNDGPMWPTLSCARPDTGGREGRVRNTSSRIRRACNGCSNSANDNFAYVRHRPIADITKP